MSARHIARVLAAAVVTILALLSTPVPSAFAQPCPDVEVVFARGTDEPPGVGGIGQEFVDSMRSQVHRRSVGVYAVNYLASTDFPRAVDGVNDAAAHVQSMAANCPNTRMVLGGFSQGAAVIGFVTADVVPDGAPASAVTGPMPPEVADHVAAVALFGKPSNGFMRTIGAPPIAIGPLYAAKTIELCVPNDPVCSDGGEWAAHGLYGMNGMVGQATTFAATRLQPSSEEDTVVQPGVHRP